MTQSKEIRGRRWGAWWRFVRGREGTEETSVKLLWVFFSQFVSGWKKGAAARVGWCLGSRVVEEKQDWGEWDGNLWGWFIAICHGGKSAQSWDLRPGSALIKPVGSKPYYSAVKCQKTSCVPRETRLLLLALCTNETFLLLLRVS